MEDKNKRLSVVAGPGHKNALWKVKYFELCGSEYSNGFPAVADTALLLLAPSFLLSSVPGHTKPALTPCEPTDTNAYRALVLTDLP